VRLLLNAACVCFVSVSPKKSSAADLKKGLSYARTNKTSILKVERSGTLAC
jgi:hypothetical protein